MATIKTRRRANGETRYTAIVRIREGKMVVHREARTFTHLAAAKSWATHREVALESHDELRRAQSQAKEHASAFTLAKLIRWYIDTFETISKWQRSRQTHLEFLERHKIGNRDARKLTTQI